MQPEPQAAPEDIQRGICAVLYLAAYTTRNWALDESIPRKQIHDLWDAIHNLPNMLHRWRDNPTDPLQDSMQELLMYFRCYNDKYAKPNLLGRFEQARAEMP